jgi:dCTP deaminase
MSILSGKEILRQVELGNIGIDPFVRENVNPASVDLTLGRGITVYNDDEIHNTKEPYATKQYYIIEAIDLLPGQLYLMHTVERVWTEKFVPVLDGKSSIGRLGVQIHLTAGFGDPGFRGQYTLEVVTHRAVRLYAGMRICQMRFHELVGEVENYQTRGHYVGEQQGPVPSMVHKQFEDK